MRLLFPTLICLITSSAQADGEEQLFVRHQLLEGGGSMWDVALSPWDSGEMRELSLREVFLDLYKDGSEITFSIETINFDKNSVPQPNELSELLPDEYRPYFCIARKVSYEFHEPGKAEYHKISFNKFPSEHCYEYFSHQYGIKQ